MSFVERCRVQTCIVFLSLCTTLTYVCVCVHVCLLVCACDRITVPVWRPYLDCSSKFVKLLRGFFFFFHHFTSSWWTVSMEPQALLQFLEWFHTQKSVVLFYTVFFIVAWAHTQVGQMSFWGTNASQWQQYSHHSKPFLHVHISKCTLKQTVVHNSIICHFWIYLQMSRAVGFSSYLTSWSRISKLISVLICVNMNILTKFFSSTVRDISTNKVCRRWKHQSPSWRFSVILVILFWLLLFIYKTTEPQIAVPCQGIIILESQKKVNWTSLWLLKTCHP